MINNKIKYSFSSAQRSSGYVFLVISLLIIYNELFFGLILFVVGLHMILSYRGVLIDPPSKRYKAYIFILGIKYGTWHPFKGRLKLKVINEVFRTYSRSLLSVDELEHCYKLYLQAEEESTCVTLYRSDDKATVEAKLTEYAVFLQ